MRTIVLAALLVTACGQTSALDGGSVGRDANADVGADANDACGDEGAFTCAGGTARVCCHGHRVSVSDGPCGLYVDASVDADTDAGPPCVPGDDAGAPRCIEYTIGVCVGGVWHRSDHVCSIVCS